MDECVSLSEFYELLDKHNWYFQMSDDSKTVSKGRNKERKLLEIAEQSKEHMRLFEEFELYHWSGKAWNTPELAKPVKPQK